MTHRFNTPTYPPRGPWDPRLSDAVCADLGEPQVLHENPWFRLCNRGGYFTVEYRNLQVAVLPVVKDEGIVFVRVRRPVVADTPLELPAGAAEPGEDPRAAAARELREETGIHIADPARFEPQPPLTISSTRMPRLAYVFRVDITREEFDLRAAHDQEIVSVECMPFAEAARSIASGDVYVSLPVAIVGRYLAGRTAGKMGTA
jgi:8-oxo-dGTP pyrophosphatase MutT (NUDIX family)